MSLKNSARRVRTEARERYDREYYQRNRDRILAQYRVYINKPGVKERKARTAKWWAIKKNYGLTEQQWNELFEVQGNCCAVCKSTDPKSKGGWHTDHDHVTGAVRGILCLPCNHAIGHSRDDEDRLLAAAEYLKRHKCRHLRLAI